MKVEARMSMSWAVRMLLGGVAFVAFGFWSLYDGKVKYPAAEESFQAFVNRIGSLELEALNSVHTQRAITKDIDDKTYSVQWVQEARGERELIFTNITDDWKHTVHGQGGELSEETLPKLYVKGPWDIRTQFIMAGICFPIGLFILLRLAWVAPRRLTAEDEALLATNGLRIPYGDIVSIDKKKWDRKGIAVVVYDVGGKRGRTKIDDWIYKGGTAVLERVEAGVGVDKINGTPEAAKVKPEESVNDDDDSAT